MMKYSYALALLLSGGVGILYYSNVFETTTSMNQDSTGVRGMSASEAEDDFLLAERELQIAAPDGTDNDDARFIWNPNFDDDDSFAPAAVPQPRPPPPPTANPTRAPTDEPTKQPTGEPTESPTESPTAAPTTPEPTSSPSASPTDEPTRTPSEEPTKTPSASPTEVPSAAPSASPSETPSERPSESPSMSPTLYPIVNSEASGIIMRLNNMDTLKGDSEDKWAEETQEHLANEIVFAIGDAYTVVEVEVTLVSQGRPNDYEDEDTNERRFLSSGNDFALRIDEPQMELIFDAYFAVQAPVDLNVTLFTIAAFNSNYKKGIYLDSLVATGDPAFAQVNGVLVGDANTDFDAEEEAAKGAAASSSATALVVGLVVVALIFAILGIAFYGRIRRRNKESNRAPTASPLSKFSLGKKEKTEKAVAKEAPAAAESAVALPEGSIMSADEENLSAIFNKRMQTGPKSTASSSCYHDNDDDTCSERSNNNSFFNYRAPSILSFLSGGTAESNTSSSDGDDDAADVKKFTVVVPPGKLGLILETSHKKFPTVQEIKPTSPFMFEVEVGDQLHTVDGEDVTMAEPEAVLRLMKSRNGGADRTFVFGRPQTKKK